MNNLSDITLLAEYCRGNVQAFDMLFRRYSPHVYATAFRLVHGWQDAEDVLQDVFVYLAQNAHTIERGEFLRLWLYRVTFSRSMDLLRRRKHALSCESLEMGGSVPRQARIVEAESLRREALSHEEVLEREMLEEVSELIPQLPDRQSATIVLHGFQGLSHAEVGAVIQCSEGAARTHYSMACRRLRELIDLRRMKSDSDLSKRKGERHA